MTARQKSPEARENLEEEAATARERPKSGIDAVEARGLQLEKVLQNVRVRAKRHAPLLIAAGATALVLTAILVMRERARRRRRERGEAILQIAGRLLRPDLDLRPIERPPSFVKTTLQNAGKELLTTAAHELGRRALAEVQLMPVASRRARSS